MYKAENDKLKEIPPIDRSVSTDIELETLDKDYWGRPKTIPTTPAEKTKAKPSRKNIAQDEYVKNLTKKQSDNKLK